MKKNVQIILIWYCEGKITVVFRMIWNHYQFKSEIDTTGKFINCENFINSAGENLVLILKNKYLRSMKSCLKFHLIDFWWKQHSSFEFISLQRLETLDKIKTFILMGEFSLNSFVCMVVLWLNLMICCKGIYYFKSNQNLYFYKMILSTVRCTQILQKPKSGSFGINTILSPTSSMEL